MRIRTRWLKGWLGLAGLCLVLAGGGEAVPVVRKRAEKLLRDGNVKDAYALFAELVRNPAAGAAVEDDLRHGLECLQRLDRVVEADAFLEAAAAAQEKNWRGLLRTARIYETVEHNGSIVAGKFERGPHRGGTAKVVNSYDRDRVRALQLMDRIRQLAVATPDEGRDKYGEFYYELTRMLLGERNGDGGWRLQTLTDLSTLPDYDEGWWYGGRGGGRGAPVNADGTPVQHRLPATWAAAKSDGERVRWAVARGPSGALDQWADFLLSQFGVQTMAEFAWMMNRAGDAEDEADGIRKDESGVYDVHTLKDNESIARLASGIKRFTLPDDQNPIALFRQMKNYSKLAEIYTDRRQYGRAVECWDLSEPKHRPASFFLKDLGRTHDGLRGEAEGHLREILGNWGQFEPVMTQPAYGKGATVEFRFRNGKAAHFEAYEVNLKLLLADVKAYVAGAPKQIDWEKVNLEDIGGRLVRQNEGKYLAAKAAAWDLALEPKADHWDRRITVQTPLAKPGAYLLTATMADGNTTRVVIWVADTALVQKPVDGGTWYFVADAASGKPIPGAALEFFGYNQRWVDNKITRGGHYEVTTRESRAVADADGQVLFRDSEKPRMGNWMGVATTPEGRLAYLGFNGVWMGDYREQSPDDHPRAFFITDRPVYRPGQSVKIKAWANTPRYDSEAARSPSAGQTVKLVVRNPRGEKLLEKNLTLDEAGGAETELALTAEAVLGVYNVQFEKMPGAVNFRVEEYKKPEFEVTVEAPQEPIALGETITATVKAKYYFGAPVAEGKIKYKVLRSEHQATWYPPWPWDWYYGPGAWWFAGDYPWYPGWRQWGVARPVCSWGPHYGWQKPPELVAEAEAPLAADGTFKIEIDTRPAKALFADRDHRYEITAEVTDASRRTIVGQGTVLAARRPFKVYAWVGRGHYRAGDTVDAFFQARTLDGKPVKGKGELTLFRLAYDAAGKPQETRVERWRLDTGDEGQAGQKIKAAKKGQYRLSYTLTDAKGHAIEGGYLFSVMGEGAGGSDTAGYRFNDLELLPDRQDYRPGDTVNLLVATERVDATVALFVRPVNGVAMPPKILRLNGKSVLEAVAVEKRDMPNFFIEAVSVSNGKIHSEMREILVPPESRVLDVQVTPVKESCKPGEKTQVKVKVVGQDGHPVTGTLALAMYDKSLDYISGGANVPDIREFFWKWRRQHYPQVLCSLTRSSGPQWREGETLLPILGVFGAGMVDEDRDGNGIMAGTGGAMLTNGLEARDGMMHRTRMMAPGGPMSMSMADSGPPMPASAPVAATAAPMESAKMAVAGEPGGGGAPEMAGAGPAVRSAFVDTALWIGSLATDANGEAMAEVTMPENLTTWKTRVWAMGPGCRVGEGTSATVTRKDLIVRLQAPRFFVQKDEVVLSANVHNFLPVGKNIKVELQLADNGVFGAEVLPGNTGTIWTALSKARTMRAGEPAARKLLTNHVVVKVPAGGEKRVDWRVKISQPGEAVVCMMAIEVEATYGIVNLARRVVPGEEPESDAMEMKFPAYVHGMLKTESFSGMIRPDGESAKVAFTVPAERRPEQTRFEVRWSPTLAGAMVDAIPYLVDYPYGCTEQTVNRFVPTVVTQAALKRLGLDLKAIREKRTNLNAQEIGDDKKRAEDWKRHNPPNPDDPERNPVFEEAVVTDMVQAGVNRLGSMQCGDGGWGWFSGSGEQSYPHATAVVVHGLLVARGNGAKVPDDLLKRGVSWLKTYQAGEIRKIKNWPREVKPRKEHADNLDALVSQILGEAKADSAEMRGFLYRDRNELSVYGLALTALSCHEAGDVEKRAMLMRNLGQYVVRDDENQTAYLKLPGNSWWWCWYGSDTEAMAIYLKLLAAVEPAGDTAPRLVKYLVNNRRHATYWNNTRDTALVIEALADYMKASGEEKPDLSVTITVDGNRRRMKKVNVDAANLFSFDNRYVLEGAELEAGPHTLEIQKAGTGPVYFNAYLTNFTLEDPIKGAGLEVKVGRKAYKLERVAKSVKAEGVLGQAVDQKVEKYVRVALADGAELKSGDLVEIEMEVESKNDYEYILLADMKGAGFEPVEVRSGYTGNDMGAYVEFRDERTVFFVRELPRGRHSVSYRLRAEIPGRFSLLPARAEAMYAPELKANSDELKLRIVE